MELAVGNLEYAGKVEDLVNCLLTIDPLYRAISKVSYVSGKIKVPWRTKYVERNREIIGEWMKYRKLQSAMTELTFIIPKAVLRANKEYVPNHGRLIVLTSYPMVKNFVDILTGSLVIGSGYPINSKNHLLRRISEAFLVSRSAIVTNFSRNADDTIGDAAHELGHTLGLKHHSECAMNYSGKSTKFCDSCKSTLSNF